MYAITGISGKVGGMLARTLLGRGQQVRAIVRDAEKGAEWAARGCQVSVAAMDDAKALSAAFAEATAVFILPPPIFDPAPGYPEMRRVVDALTEALKTAQPSRVLSLSTVGAQATQDNLLSQLSMVERGLSTLPLPVTFLRPAWYLDNAAWDVATARDLGVIHSFLAPLDRAIPMVSTGDVGRVAADLIQQATAKHSIAELEGPRRVSPNDLAHAFARALGKPVRAQAVPRDTWEPLFRSQGMQQPNPRIRMLDGFNEGWIDFAAPAAQTTKGSVDADAAIEALVRPKP
jgi:NAD(P)H dehydrogenase (quinone)